MTGWVRMVLVVAVAVLPGGFLLLFGFLLGRALLHAWREAAQASGGPVQLRAVLHALPLRALWAEARLTR